MYAQTWIFPSVFGAFCLVFVAVLGGCHDPPFGCLRLRSLLPWISEVQAGLVLDQHEDKEQAPLRDLHVQDAGRCHDSFSCVIRASQVECCRDH